MEFKRKLFISTVQSISVLSILSLALLTGCGGSGSSETSNTDTTGDNTVVDGNDNSTGDNNVDSTSILVINEIVADATEGGNDWIEFYAQTDIPDASIFSVVDDNADHTAQALPNVSLIAGDYLVVQAISEDDTPPETGYYVSFKLGGDDAVTLYQNNIEIDQLDWNEGEALESFSYGLLNNVAQTLMPTPNARNSETTLTTVPSDIVINNDASLRINEIVADNIASSNGEGSYDWIEFLVTGTNEVTLSDYTISDSNGILKALPNINIQPGEFYRVYATTDISSVNGMATADVKLGSSDNVNLYLGDDLIDSLDWSKGQALYGYSFGRFPDGSDSTTTLTPTANDENQLVKNGPLIINEIVANDENDGYDWFELYNNSDENINLSDYQVLDSSDDIEAQTLPDITLAAGDYMVIYATDEDVSDYSVTFKLGKTDELSLLHNDETIDYVEWDDSDVIAGFSYGVNPDDGNHFTLDTLVPTLGQANIKASAFDSTTVSNLYFDISTDNWQSILASPLDEEYHETSITFNGVTLDSVAIRTKGGSSLRAVSQSTSDRYSFKIDVNEYVSGQKFFGLKKFTLQNSFNDPSYMREVIAYQLLDEMGVATPQHAYVNVFINNELFGLYLMVEAIDGEFLEDHFDNANGDLYKPDGVGSDLNWINNNIESYTGLNLQTNEETTDGQAFINFIEKMSQGSTEVINEDSVLRYMAVSTSLSNLDSYHGALAHNYYIYEQDNEFSLLPWDFNEAFGTFAMGCSADVRDLYIDEPTDGPLSEKPLIANVFAKSSNLDIYHGYLTELINNQLSSSAFSTRVNNIADVIRTHVQNDPSGFYTATDFENNLTSSVGRFYGLTEFMTHRVNSMSNQLVGNSASSSGDDTGFCGGNSGGPPAR